MRLASNSRLLADALACSYAARTARKNRNVRKHMPRRALSTFIAAVAFVSANASGTEAEDRFVSWYNGWGSHQVWGVGRVAGSYENAFVECDGKQIKVVPIYDIHASRQPPTRTQSSSFARSHNIAFANVLAAKGVKCAFQPEREGK